MEAFEGHEHEQTPAVRMLNLLPSDSMLMLTSVKKSSAWKQRAREKVLEKRAGIAAQAKLEISSSRCWNQLVAKRTMRLLTIADAFESSSTQLPIQESRLVLGRRVRYQQ